MLGNFYPADYCIVDLEFAITNQYKFPSLPDAQCMVFSDKFIMGGAHDEGVIMPVEAMLRTSFESDAHFVQYVTPKNMRVNKGMKEPLQFSFCAYDLDYSGHGERPTNDKFEHLQFHFGLIDNVPNIIYATRGGARAIYLIKPIASGDVFEAHAKVLGKKIAEPIHNGKSGYELDTAASDWTRMFRCPRVIRDDEAQYDYPVRYYHNKILDLLRFKIEIKKYRPISRSAERITNFELLRLLRDAADKMRQGSRNTVLYACFFRLWRRWPDDAEDLLPTFLEIARNKQMAEREVMNCFRSAERGAKNA